MKKPSQRPIGMFDSGMGGLTVARALISLLPGERIIYLGDTARYPYGPRSRETVTRFALQNTQFLVDQEIKLLVVACNTVSAFALSAIQEKFSSLPVLGVVEPCVEEIVQSRLKGPVGIIGTEGTIQCRVYEKALQARQPRLRVLTQACPLFVPFVEEGIVHGPLITAVIDHYLRPLKEAGLEALVLACTHYPLLHDALKYYWLPQTLRIIDSAANTAQAAKDLLEKNRLLSASRPGETPERRFYVTDARDRFQEWGSRFLGRPLEKVIKVDW